MNSSSNLFRLVFFFGFGCTVRFTDCSTISAVYGQSDVEFTCVISPYTSSQRWYVGSDIVAVCGANSCVEEPSNPARYSFTPNLSSGIFIFKIDSINSTDDKRIIGCYNGIDTETIAINFPVDGGTGSGGGNGSNLWYLFFLLFIIPIGVLIARAAVKRCKASNNGSQNEGYGKFFPRTCFENTQHITQDRTQGRGDAISGVQVIRQAPGGGNSQKLSNTHHVPVRGKAIQPAENKGNDNMGGKGQRKRSRSLPIVTAHPTDNVTQSKEDRETKIFKNAIEPMDMGPQFSTNHAFRHRRRSFPPQANQMAWDNNKKTPTRSAIDKHPILSRNTGGMGVAKQQQSVHRSNNTKPLVKR